MTEEAHGGGHGAQDEANIEKIIQSLYKAASDDHSENIKAFEKHQSRASQAKLERATQYAVHGSKRKGILGAHESAEEAIGKVYSDGKVDVEKQESLHKVGIAYITQFFKNAKPSVLNSLGDTHPELKKLLGKPVADLTKDEAKDLYETLADHFDREVGAGQIRGVQSMQNLVDLVQGEFKDDEEVTAEMLGSLFKTFAETHKQGLYQMVNTHAAGAYITHLPTGVYAAHVLKKIKRRGNLEFKKLGDASRFTTANVGTLMEDLHLPFLQRKYDDMKLKKHGLYVKEEKEEAHGGGGAARHG